MKRKGRKGMKGRCLWLVAIIMLSCGVAMAGECASCVNCPSITDTDTDTTRQEWGYGVGLDTVVYRSDKAYLQQVTVETRYDIENRETRVFAVAQVDLFSLLGGK